MARAESFRQRVAVNYTSKDYCHLYELLQKPLGPFSFMLPKDGAIIDSCTRFFSTEEFQLSLACVCDLLEVR